MNGVFNLPHLCNQPEKERGSKTRTTEVWHLIFASRSNFVSKTVFVSNPFLDRYIYIGRLPVMRIVSAEFDVGSARPLIQPGLGHFKWVFFVSDCLFQSFNQHLGLEDFLKSLKMEARRQKRERELIEKVTNSIVICVRLLDSSQS